MNKITGQRNYGHLPLITTKRYNPWSDIHVDMVGPWTITVTNEETGNEQKRRAKHLPVTTPVLDSSRSSNATPSHLNTSLRNSTATGCVVTRYLTE